MSHFSWLDYSEPDRRQMMDVIQLFREPGTLDELGIGTVRDAFADRLFPGTSTIETRARYFLFVPWIYRYLEKRQVPASRIADRARYDEARLMQALAQSHPDETGVIGRDAGRNLKRLPSNIYWRGLSLWGLRQFPGSQSQYHQSLDSFYAANRRLRQDYTESDEREPLRHNWHADLPVPPEGFPDEATLWLTGEEAHYLRERIVTNVPGTLLAYLVEHGRPAPPTRFPWQHPQYAEFPLAQQVELVHARNFSEVLHGAALLYNFMLAEQRAALGGKQEQLDRYASELAGWADMLARRQAELAQWDRHDQFWELVYETSPRVPYLTRRFIQEWFALALATGGAATVADSAHARQLISDREARLKRRLARLHNQRALELWSGESGTAQLNFRWNVVQTLIDDILRGSHGPEPVVEAARA
jgi:hypothetical protein